MLPESIPVSLIRQFLFCPRVPWHMTAGTPAPSPLWVRQGVEHHQRQRRLTRPRKLRALGLANAERHFEIPLESERLGLHGIVDLVLLTDEEVVPVEFKLQDAPPTRAICLQLLAYGLLGEEEYVRPFRRGLVICGSRSRTYPIQRTRKLEDRLEKTLICLRQDRSSPVLPPSSAQANKCTQCEYLAHCNDRF